MADRVKIKNKMVIRLIDGVNVNEEIILPLFSDGGYEKPYDENDPECDSLIDEDDTEGIINEYKKMGIEIISEIEDSFGEVFAKVKLPDNWGVKADAYDGIYRIIDDKGNIKITFFGRNYEDSSVMVNFREWLF